MIRSFARNSNNFTVVWAFIQKCMGKTNKDRLGDQKVFTGKQHTQEEPAVPAMCGVGALLISFRRFIVIVPTLKRVFAINNDALRGLS